MPDNWQFIFCGNFNVRAIFLCICVELLLLKNKLNLKCKFNVKFIRISERNIEDNIFNQQK